MAANIYITATDLLGHMTIRELAQVAAPAGVAPASIESEIAEEIATPGSSGNADAAEALVAIDAAVEAANSTADGYLAGRYPLPLSVVPGLVKLDVMRVARYILHDVAPPTAVKDRHDEALKRFEAIRDGKIQLETDAGEVTATGGAPQHSAPARVYDSDGTQMNAYLGGL